MFLKTIEIRGFKSFADKTELAFKKGVTAVVGPNGSGKSNISDAIRWVLGEQSAKSLRGGKMEDVIFAGTQYRKPVGLAQVSLTLDNSENELPIEYNDVIISRRLYRSGESEYFINNTPCRLKDIHELFMDTGIGKEGYSIIGQGKIDAILSGKAEERRALLEEAAGIVKFKTRKEEAEKKLNNTEQNLIRINDILSTYEERLEPLRIDNEKAKKFIEISDELKSLEISLIVDSIKNVQENIDNISKEIGKINEDKNRLNEERDKYKRLIEELENRLESQEKKSSEDKVIYYQSKEKCKELEGDIQLLQERIKNINFNIDKNKKELSIQEEKISFYYKSKQENESKLLETTESQKSVNKKIESLEDYIQSSNGDLSILEKEIETLRNQEIETSKSISHEENKVEVLNNDINNLHNKIESLKNTCENLENSIKINLTTGKILQDNKNKVSVDIENLNEEIKNSKKQMNLLINKINEKDKELRSNHANLNKLEANHQMLNNLEKQYEGYARSVKILMKHIDEGKIENIKGKSYVLGDIIEVKKELETAIEISLGGGISHIITEDDSTAKTLINHLKRNNLGRATFLPLTIIKGKRIMLNDNLKRLKGFIGIASDLISYDSMFTPAINYVLGRTLICDTMDNALNFAKVTQHSYKIVTLEGEVINPGGALTGGSVYHKNVSIIGRKREMEELKDNIENLKKHLTNLNNELLSYKDQFKLLDDKCLNLRDEIHYNNIELTKIQGELSNINNEKIRLTQSLNISIKEKEIVNKKIEDLSQELKKKIDNIKSLKNKEKNLFDERNNLNNKILEREKSLSSYKEELVELKVNKAQIDEILTAEIKEINRLERDIEELLLKVNNIKNDISKDIEIMEKSNSSITHNKEIILKLQQTIEIMKKDFDKYEAIRVKLKEDIRVNINRAEGLNQELNKIEDNSNKKNITKAKYEMEMQSYFSKLNNDMQLTLAEAQDLSKPVTDLEEFKRNISILKGKISSLGTVNLKAIEEYEEVTNKYGFMSTQRDDLENAKNELNSVIDEMILKMKKVFSGNFEILRKNFTETFKELFKGGSADLILADGDELSSNIEINVQPPGKKLQNINLMSGGEKVLSAIALLFAILKMKPTPFCILDEIEAALDDANVYRYAEFLNKFADNIQFIVITHRKGTMEASDVLYGVTMEEKGVSKIVSVDLSA
ncbi:chromosome segregation protein SMC [Clostridium frigidicarnis]|uniref:Chromosome partition protein Smc n=1 Tax=Clostridium frigidicarnis TaxID=84698 RepID=A0A1I0ZP17_9CLOT|nr:chromosome segregation protein SMC [Clostridium frigidicarnis]SFB27247.1 condensin subunit Smc [Clostridium frigidicarnis]